MQSSGRCNDQQKWKRSPFIRSPGKVRISELQRVWGIAVHGRTHNYHHHLVTMISEVSDEGHSEESRKS
jgi:hypothetical protein